MKTLLKVAWVAGAAPLVVGTAIFFLWLWLRAGDLVVAGLITIDAGLCSVFVGAICLAIYLWRNRQSTAVPRQRLVWQAAASMGLILANFIAAGGYLVGASIIMDHYHLSIRNGSSEPLRDVRVEGPGASLEYGEIHPGQTVKRSFWIDGEGMLLLTATRGGEKIKALVDSYITNGSGTHKLFVVGASGEVPAEEKRTGLPSP